MFQLNISKKMTAMLQVWISVLLLIVATFMSLAPIITLRTNADSLNEMLDKVAEDTTIDLGEIPETVDVSALKIVKSVGVIAKIAKAAMNAAKDVAENTTYIANSAETLGDIKYQVSGSDLDLENLDEFQSSASDAVIKIEKMESAVEDTQKKVDDLGAEIESILETEDGKETLLIALSIGATVASNFNTDDMSGAGALAGILTMLITVIALIALLVLTFLLPVMLLFSTLIALLTALIKLGNPEEAASKVSKRLLGFVSLPFTLMLFQCVVPGMTYGKGIVSICVVTIFAAVLGLAISRLHSYNASTFMYLNVVQGASVLGIVGFMIFFFNLVKTNILTSFLNGKFGEYVTNVSEIAKVTSEETQNAYIIDLVLMLIYLLLTLGSVRYLEKCVHRLACSSTVNKKGKAVKDSALGRAIMMIAIYAIPAYVMAQKHFYNNPCSTASQGDASFLILETAAQKNAFNMVLVGAILMVVAEVALIVLKSLFCHDMKGSDMAEVMSGGATGQPESAEPVSEAAPQ